MFFTHNRSLLAETLRNLQCAPVSNPWREPVCAGMEYLLEHDTLFDRNISDSPFFKHFFRVVCRVSPDIDDSLIFMLFEDLAIFFREKTLRDACLHAGPESQLLALFEASDEWSPQDATLVSTWYWSVLPRLAGQCPLC